MKKTWKQIGAAAMAFTMVAGVLQPAGSFVSAADTQTGTAGSEVYEIYPEPHQMTYGDSTWVLRQNANLIVEDGIDEATEDRLEEVMELKNMTGENGTSVIPRATNILVGIYGSDGYVDNYVETNYAEVSADLFEKTDAYFIASEKDKLVVLGRDTDAAFYGLTTLYHIFAQMENYTIHSFEIEDYADIVSRGFIEGYYGNPWSLQDRIDLMTWGGYYKLNSYFYAPKDDPKHNAKWRELYTQEELDTLIKPLADAGNESKCRFVYALHPYMNNAIRYTSDELYKQDLAIMQAKFEQVITAGVRQIAILADDAGNVGGDNYIKTLNDMTDWLVEMRQTYPDLKLTLPFCTQEYMGNGQSYYAAFPENVQIVMTGGRVWGEVSNQFTSTVVSNTGRGPYMWVNWPCTDNSKKHLIMGGYTTFLHPGVDPSNIEGIVLNPMQQSEPSQVAIFGNACYSWNIWEDSETADLTWENSFKYVDHNSAIETKASEAFRELSKHMMNQAMDSRVTPLQESVEIREELANFRDKLTAGNVTAEDCNALIPIFEELQNAARVYSSNPGDSKLRDQMIYWLDCWEETTTAALAYFDAIKASVTGNGTELIKKYNEGRLAFAQSKTHGYHYVDHTEYAEVGVQHIVPFILAMESYVRTLATTELDPTAVIQSFITSRTDQPTGGVDAMFDGSDSSAAVFKNPNVAKAGDYIGVMYNRPQKIEYIRFLLGAGKDHFDSAKIQYTEDGTTWTDLSDTIYTGVEGQVQEAVVEKEALPADFEAKGVRFIATADNVKDMWLEVREITVRAAGDDDGSSDTEAERITGTITYSGISERSGSSSNYFDGNDDTVVMLAKGPYEQGDPDRDTVAAGSTITVTFSEPKSVGTFTFAQGDSSAPGDVFTSATVQYQTTGDTTWKDAGKLTNARKQTVDFGGVENVTAVRIYNDATVRVWVRVGEIDIREGVYDPSSNDKYIYTNADVDVSAVVEEGSMSLTPGNVTLPANGGFIGLKLDAIRTLEDVSAGSLPEGLELQVSPNTYEWQEYDDESDAADSRYVRVFNTTKNPITWNMTEFVVKYYVAGQYTVESDFAQGRDDDMRANGSVGNVFDGKLNTIGRITGSQIEGKYVLFDLGVQRDIKTFRYYIVETEMDYPRSVVFEAAAEPDAQNWTEILKVEDPDFVNESNESTAKDMQDISLYHDSSNPGYMYAENTDLNVTARYIRARVTKTYNARWLAFSELVVNGGEYVSMESKRDIVSEHVEVENMLPSNMLDGDTNSTYISSAENSSFSYTLSEPKDVKTIRLIQVGAVSDADVTAELYDEDTGKKAEVTLGTLGQAINEFVIPDGKTLLRVQVSWDEVKPEIAEIFTFTEKEDASDAKAELAKAIETKVDSAGWTKKTKDAYEAAVKAAETVVDNPYISKASTENVLGMLLAAQTEGVERFTSEALADEVNGALNNDENIYTAGSFRSYADALTDAENALADVENLSKAAGEAILAALTEAKAGLVYSMMNRETAILLLEDMEALNQEEYTDIAWEAVEAAKVDLEEIIAKDTDGSRVNPKEYESLIEEARRAIEDKEGIGRPDKAELKKAIQEAEGKKEADYTAESWKVFADALAKAKETDAKVNVAQKEVDEAAKALKEAMDALVEKSEEPGRPFKFDDVREGDWYYDSVKWAYENGIMTGYAHTPNLFGPADSLKRAQFAQIIYNYAGQPKVEFEEVLRDVKEGDWYADPVIWAYKEGVITGYTNTKTFGANDDITREQMATILYRYAKKPAVKDKDVLKEYPDVAKVSPYAADAMMWAVENGIITGDNGNLNPLGTANRAVAAAMMQRTIPILEAK